MKTKNKQGRQVNKKRIGIGWILILLAGWEVLARSGTFAPTLFPTLQEIGKALLEALLHGELIAQTGYSLVLILQGLFFGLLFAVAAASASMASRHVEDLTDTLTTLAHPLPGIALLPIIILWFGTGTLSILVIIIHSVLWPMVVNIRAGFRVIPRSYTEVGRNLGMNTYQVIKDIMMPASLPYLLSGIRIGWARAWRALISAEMIFGAVGGQGGLGWYIFKQRVFMDTAGMFAGLIVIVVIGMVVENYIFTVVENKTVRKWGMMP